MAEKKDLIQYVSFLSGRSLTTAESNSLIAAAVKFVGDNVDPTGVYDDDVLAEAVSGKSADDGLDPDMEEEAE